MKFAMEVALDVVSKNATRVSSRPAVSNLILITQKIIKLLL